MTDSQKKRLAGAAIIVMVSTVLSRITGYLREMLISNKLGVGSVGDAYNVAFLIPDLMYNLILGGAIAAALIPVLSGYIEKDEEKDGWKAVGTFINLTIITMVFFCILGMIFTDKLIPIVAKGFRKKSIDDFVLAVKLTRILFPSVSFLMIAGMCNGVLNSYHRFTAASFGPVIYNIGGVLSLLILGSNTALGAERVAYGVAASAFIYFVFQVMVAFKNLKYYRFKLYLNHPGFIKLFKLAIPSLISSSVVQINLIISASFITSAVAGSLVLYSNANRTWQLPLGIFAQSMGVALLPTLSAKAAIGNIEEYRRILMKGLKTVLLLTIPSALAFIVLREPIIRVMFKFSSDYTEYHVQTTGIILMFFSLALISQSIVVILTRAFYAVNDTKTPLFIGVSTILVNGLLSYFLFNYTRLNVAGMAIAYSASSTIYALMLIVLLNYRSKRVDVRDLLIFSLKAGFAALVMGLVLYPVDRILPVSITSKLSQVIFLGIEAAIGIVVYFALVVFMRIEEGIFLYEGAIKRIKRLLKIS